MTQRIMTKYYVTEIAVLVSPQEVVMVWHRGSVVPATVLGKGKELDEIIVSCDDSKPAITVDNILRRI